MVFVAFGVFGSTVYSQITGTIPAARCGEGPLVLKATASSGTIKWYDVPFYGTAITEGISDGGATFTTPSLPVTKTYYVDAVDNANCSLNSGSERVQVIATISANSIQSIIFYTSNTFCKSVSGAQEVTRTGTAGGTYTVIPSGLTISASTGAITPSSSTEGTYAVTYTVTAAEGCTEVPTSTEVIITLTPVTPTISYTGSPFCTSPSSPVAVSHSGATGGSYSASPSGLTINSSSGTITPSTSSSGTYTITYFVPGLGGCAPQTATTSVIILQLPTAAISYSSAVYTKNQEIQTVSLTGTGVFTGGVYSAPGGLTINASTGTITPGSCTAGTYTITYTLAAASPCAQVTTTTSVTIYPLPTATISGTTAVCINSDEPVITFTGAAGTGPYTFIYTVNSGLDQTVTTTSGSSVTVAQPTSVSGTYTYTLESVSDAHSSSQSQEGTATITVTPLPVAKFNYTGTPYCSNGSNPSPTFLEGGIAGTFSSTAGLNFISTTTGQINLASSTEGTYTVTNTIAAAGGCGIVTATTSVTLAKLPVATFSYAGSPYCQDVTDPSPTFTGGGVAGIFSSLPAGLTFINVNTGQVDLGNSALGDYTITNTIASANGCNAVTATSTITVNSAVLVGTPVFLAGETSSRCGAAETVPYDGTATNSTSLIFTLDATSASQGNSINASTGVVSYSAAWSGTTTITATATAYCGNTTTSTHVVTIAPAVTVGTPSFALGTTSTRCQGAAVLSYTATATNSTSIYYSMDEASRTGGNSIDPSSGAVTYAGTWSGTTTITATGTADCSNTATSDHVVTVNPLPLASAGGSQAICSNATATVSGASSANGTILWTENGAGTITSGATGLTPTYTPAAGDVGNAVTLTMTVTSSYASCSSATATATYTVNVNPLPAAPTAGNVTVTYDGAAHTGTATAPDGSTVVWYTASTGGSVTVAPTGTNVGSYTAYAQSKADLTPTQCVSASRTLVTVQINKAESTITATGTTSFTYSAGVPQGPAGSSVTGSGGTVTYSYVGTGSTVYAASATKPTNAGSYTVAATVAADGNYNAKTSSAYAFEIKPVAPTGSAAQTFCSGSGPV